jgi:DNA ligase D-like protein (predicted 3'-phosphoesterase)
MTALPPRFVLHEHVTKHHHFDFRLERDGVLVSWAVPRGLPERAGERRLAIAVDDHPSGYIAFEGTIPEGQYGAGVVKIADTGAYEPRIWEKDRIEVVLHGVRFSGTYTLVRFRKAGDKAWLIVHSAA